MGISTDVTEVVTKYCEEVHQAVKYSYLVSYMLKSCSLLAQIFKYVNKAKENILNHMCNLVSRAYWSNCRRDVSSYLDFESRKYQCRLLNPTPLDFSAGYIMKYDVGHSYLKSLPQIRLNLIGGSITSY